MVLVNEEIRKNLSNPKTSDFNFKLVSSGSNKYVLTISKELYDGFMTNGVPVSYLRLFFEGSGSVSIDKLFVYKFNNTKFEKINNIETNIITLPISANLSNNSFIDVPIGTMDETIDVEITAPSSIKRLFVAINGSITGISNKNLTEYLKTNP